MRRTCRTALAALIIFACAASPAAALSRIKDLANIEGVRQNQLIGYGLVVGLNGTGDTLNNAPFTKQSLQAMLERLGVNIRGQQIRTGNVAAVMVTADLPPFATQGTRIDVTASAMGDAKSLQGGTLLVTPLLGADGNVYAVAQGSLTIGGFQAQGQAASITRGVPTVGRLPNGAIIEREIEFALNSIGQLRLALRNADFTTAKRIAEAINDYIGAPIAEPLDPSTVQLTLPKKFPQNIVQLLTEIEQLQVEPDEVAKIVIDERSGVIVIGRDVRVSTVAVAAGQSYGHHLGIAAGQSAGAVVARPHRRGAAHAGRRPGRRQRTGAGPRRRVAAANRRRAQCARHRAARSHHHPAGDQGRRRDPGRYRGDVMTNLNPVDLGASLSSIGDASSAQAQATLRVKGKAKEAAQNFEANFLSSMFQDMFTGIDGDGPFGGSGALKIWRSFMTDQIAKIIRQSRRHRHSADGLRHVAQRTGPEGHEYRSRRQLRRSRLSTSSRVDGETRAACSSRRRALVHAGRIRSAAALEPSKAEFAGQLFAAGERLKSSAKFLRHSAPARRAALVPLQDRFRGVLQKNMIVLATAHAVSEGIVRRLSGDLARKASPQVYGASGRAAAPNPKHGRPLAISRTS